MSQIRSLGNISAEKSSSAAVRSSVLGVPQSGNCEVTCTVTKNGSDDAPVIVQVLNGETVVASQGVTPTSTPLSITLNFPASALAPKSDVPCNADGLSVRVIPGIMAPCCPKPLPETLQLHIITPICADDVVIPLQYREDYFFGSGPIPGGIRVAWGACDSICSPFNQEMWYGAYDPVTMALDWICLYCDGSNWHLATRGVADGLLFNLVADSVDCEKGVFTFTGGSGRPRFVCPSDGKTKQLWEYDILSFRVQP